LNTARASRVVVIGDLLHDLLARVEDVALGTDTFAPIHTAAGGSGANAAAWFARLGVEAHFTGRVGEDIFGTFLEGELERAGVTPHLAWDPSLATGKVFVLVGADGERTMITDRGASENLSPEDLPKELFQRDSHLHLSGYTFSEGSRRATALEALRLARESAMTVSVDPSSVPLLEIIGPRRFLEWTVGADLCFPNLEEGAFLAGSRDPDSILTKLCENYSAVVLKLGSEGAIYRGGDGERIHLPAASARAVDTTGAGDALCAGFLAVWISGFSGEAALKQGIQTAGQVVEHLGSRPEP
jgi:sugar/nucleoside kinase (ribokinase family)